ncbi:MAG: alpha/beta hydrolase [Acidimicrobiia bacterium]
MQQLFDMDDGIQVHARVEGAGDTILLVHGLGGAALDYQDHITWLGDLGTVVAVDLRGHGESDHPRDAGAYSVTRFASDLQAIVEHIGRPLRCVIAHSMGGMVVQRAVARGLLEPSSLVLFSTCPGSLPGLSTEIAAAGAEMLEHEGIEPFRRMMDQLNPFGSPASREYRDRHPEYVAIQDWRWAHTSPAMYAALLRELAGLTDITAELRTVRCAAAVLVGDEDAPFLEPTARIAEALPNASCEFIAGAGHHPQLHQPERWASAVRALIAAN